MCLIIVRPPTGKPVTKSEFFNAWEDNSDGGGLMFAENGRLHVWKPYYKAHKFWRDYNQIQKQRPDSTIVLHFRLATHGLRDTVNTHPHWVHEKQVAMVHNGILPLTERSAKLSDTAIWCRDIFSKIKPEDLMTDECKKEFEEDNRVLCNKLVFMDATGKVQIWKEVQGNWEDGNWYSNFSYRYQSLSCRFSTNAPTSCFSEEDRAAWRKRSDEARASIAARAEDDPYYWKNHYPYSVNAAEIVRRREVEENGRSHSWSPLVALEGNKPEPGHKVDDSGEEVRVKGGFSAAEEDTKFISLDELIK